MKDDPGSAKVRHPDTENSRIEVAVALQDADRFPAIVHSDHTVPLILQDGSH